MGIVYNSSSNEIDAININRSRRCHRRPHRSRQYKVTKAAHKRKVLGKGYIKRTPCRRTISRQRAFKRLTPRNVQFLRSLNLRVINPPAGQK